MSVRVSVRVSVWRNPRNIVFGYVAEVFILPPWVRVRVRVSMMMREGAMVMVMVMVMVRCGRG